MQHRGHLLNINHINNKNSKFYKESWVLCLREKVSSALNEFKNYKTLTRKQLKQRVYNEKRWKILIIIHLIFIYKIYTVKPGPVLSRHPASHGHYSSEGPKGCLLNTNFNGALWRLYILYNCTSSSNKCLSHSSSGLFIGTWTQT